MTFRYLTTLSDATLRYHERAQQDEIQSLHALRATMLGEVLKCKAQLDAWSPLTARHSQYWLRGTIHTLNSELDLNLGRLTAARALLSRVQSELWRRKTAYPTHRDTRWGR